jgi:hypothetical protein
MALIGAVALGLTSLAAGSALAVSTLPARLAQPAAGDTWHTAEEVPGTAALNSGGYASTQSVSCASAGNCSAGGYYASTSDTEAFVVTETSGTWDKAIEVPGTASLNSGAAGVYSVSCASAGNCSAGGVYQDSAGDQQAFVVTETSGTWGTAIEVPGTATLNVGGVAAIVSVSCALAGDCSAGGLYSSSSGLRQALVVTETNGTWGTAIEVPGTAALNTGGSADADSVSCASAGNCTAAGFYQTKSAWQPFVATETAGSWGAAAKVAGIAALSKGRNSQGTSVSCPTAGNCSLGGFYTDSAGGQQVFVAGETDGTWGTAAEVPGTGALNSGANATLNAVSCASAGNCTAGGAYTTSDLAQQAFIVTETDGTWGTAEEVPGTGTLNAGGRATVFSVSCSAAQECGAGGFYTDSSAHEQAFVVSKS